MYEPGDTICAIATGAAGARGIVRISGPDAISMVAHAFDRSAVLTAARSAHITSGNFTLSAGARLPCQLYAWPGSRSYTREPLIELHTLGALPLLEALLHDLCDTGARLAQPGEFTLRAFLAGRIDLTQAEAVLGVIHAQQQSELQVALQQLAGGVARPLTAARDDLLDLLAELEAGLDFVEEYIQFIQTADVRRRLDEARQTVNALHEQTTSRGDTTQLARIVLVGRANVGKSSLFNLLADDARALVADRAGTTRDYVTGRLTIADQSYLLVDTAGLLNESPAAQLDRLAQSSAQAQHATATLQLFCIDSSRPLNEWERDQLSALQPAQLVVLTKTDCPAALDDSHLLDSAIHTSSAQQQGLEQLRQTIAQKVAALRPRDTGLVSATAQRCRAHLQQAADSLSRAAELASDAGREELIAAEVRVALAELGQVVGAVYTDDLLDRIFSRFCIGK